jgi:hypothetical protein
MNVEPCKAIHALKLLEPVERHLGRARDELQEFGSLFLVKGADCAPEPDDLRRRGCVACVFGVVLPVINVDFWEAGDEEFEFLFREDGYEVSGDNLIESCEVVSWIVLS